MHIQYLIQFDNSHNYVIEVITLLLQNKLHLFKTDVNDFSVFYILCLY